MSFKNKVEGLYNFQRRRHEEDDMPEPQVMTATSIRFVKEGQKVFWQETETSDKVDVTKAFPKKFLDEKYWDKGELWLDIEFDVSADGDDEGNRWPVCEGATFTMPDKSKLDAGDILSAKTKEGKTLIDVYDRMIEKSAR